MYIDDTLITGAIEEARLKNLEEMFRCLQLYGVSVESTKCEFLSDSVKYLANPNVKE